MKIAWATDIHLNAAEPDVVDGFCDGVASSGADCLLLGGDIAEAMDVEEQLAMLATRLRMPIYFVLGNHDYYGSTIEAVRERMRRLEDPHLHWLPATAVTMRGSASKRAQAPKDSRAVARAISSSPRSRSQATPSS